MKVAVLFLALLVVAFAGADERSEARRGSNNVRGQHTMGTNEMSNNRAEWIQSELVTDRDQYVCCHCGHDGFFRCGRRYRIDGRVYVFSPNVRLFDNCWDALRGRIL